LVGAGGAPRLIYILEVHEVFFRDIAEDILERENLPDEPDIALGRVFVVALCFAHPEFVGTGL